jgi:hypothetical protein
MLVSKLSYEQRWKGCGVYAYKDPVKVELANGENQRDRVLSTEELTAYLENCSQPWQDAASDAERTASLIVARNESYLRNEPLAIVRDSRSWPSVGVIRIRVPFPKYRSEQTPMPNSDCRRTEYIYLPDEMKLSTAIRDYAEMRKLGGDRYQPFPGEPERYQTNARLLLRAWDPSGRLMLNKIASALFERVMSLTGDDAVRPSGRARDRSKRFR